MELNDQVAQSIVADAIKIFKQFCNRQAHIVSRGNGAALNDDDRFALIAAQLLAINLQLERIAKAFERMMEMEAKVYD